MLITNHRGATIKQWVISVATAALLAAGLIGVATFDENRGYPILDPRLPLDTLWFADSSTLVEYAANDSVRRAVIRDWIDSTSNFKWYHSSSGAFTTDGESFSFDGKSFATWDAMTLYARKAAAFAQIDTLKAWITIKIGDLKYHKDGEIVDVYYPPDHFIKTGDMVTAEVRHSAIHRKVYAVLQIKRGWMDNAYVAMQDTGDTKEWNEELQCSTWVQNENYRRNRTRILPKRIAELLDNDSIETLWRSSATVPIIDISGLKPESLLTATYGVSFDSIPDSNSIAGGSVTVGTGGDYTTYYAWNADLAAALTSNMTVTQTTAVTETGAVAIAIDLDDDTLTMTSALPPLGNPASGYTISYGGARNCFTFTTDGAGKLEVKNLYFKRTSGGSSARYALQFDGNTNAHAVSIHDNLFDDQNNSSSGMKIADQGCTYEIYNNKAWDYKGTAFFTDGVSVGALFENNTAYNCSTSFNFDNEKLIARNNVSYACKKICFTKQDSATGYNNASSDTSASNATWKTASGNIKSIVVANEVISTSDASTFFLKLKNSGEAWDNGAAVGIAANTTGIRGNARTYPSIGGDEYAPWPSAPPSLNLDTTAAAITWVGNREVEGYATCAIASTPINDYPKTLDTLLQGATYPNVIFVEGGETNIIAESSAVQIVEEWKSALDSIYLILDREGLSGRTVYHFCNTACSTESHNDTAGIVDSLMNVIEDSLAGVYASVFAYKYIGGSGIPTVDLEDPQHPSELGYKQWGYWFGDSITTIFRKVTATCLGQSVMLPYAGKRSVNFAIDSVLNLRDGANSCDTTGLVHWWPMDTVLDYIGSNHGTLQNEASFVATAGVYNGYLALDGNNDYMSCGDVTALNAATNVSVEFWFKQVDNTATDAFINKTNGAADSSFKLITLSGNLRVTIGKTDGALTLPVLYYENAVWNHIVITWNGAAAGNDKIGFYLNGKKRTLTDALVSPLPSKTPDMSGQNFNFGLSSSSLNGYFDNAKIYSRTLTAYDVANAYGAGIQKWRNGDTCNGIAKSDTALHDQIVDTVIVIDSASGDNAFFPAAAGFVYNLDSALYADSGSISYDTSAEGWQDSIRTVDFLATIYGVNTNAGGRSDSTKQTVIVFYSDTTRIDTVCVSIYDTARYVAENTDQDVIYNSDTSEAVQDTTVLDSFVTISGNMTIYIRRDSIASCSTHTDSSHDVVRNDSASYGIDCLGDTVEVDTFAYDTTYADSNTNATDYCRFILIDSIPYDTVTANALNRNSLNMSQFNIGF